MDGEPSFRNTNNRRRGWAISPSPVPPEVGFTEVLLLSLSPSSSWFPCETTRHVMPRLFFLLEQMPLSGSSRRWCSLRSFSSSFFWRRVRNRSLVLRECGTWERSCPSASTNSWVGRPLHHASTDQYPPECPRQHTLSLTVLFGELSRASCYCCCCFSRVPFGLRKKVIPSARFLEERQSLLSHPSTIHFFRDQITQ